MKLIFSVLLASCFCCQVFSEDRISNDIARLTSQLESLKDSLHDYLKQDKTPKGPPQLSDEVERRAVGDNYECEFDGSCTDDFTLTSEGKTIAWKRINNFHNRILDKSKAGSGFMMADMRNLKAGDKSKAEMTMDIEITQANQCLEFDYTMYTNSKGCDVARFKVTLNCGDTVTELFRTTDSAYLKWTRVRADITESPGTKCKIVWYVAKGLNVNLHTAVGVDMVKINTGACKPPGTPEDTSFLACNFDNLYSFCDWTRSGTAPYRFATHGTNNGGTGPDRPYAYASYPSGTRGSYFYLESRLPTSQGTTLSLVSPTVKSGSAKKCLRFAYSMYGQSMGTMKGYILKEGEEEKEIFSESGNRIGITNKWNEGYINLPASSEFKVKFRMQINGTKSDLALDAIEIEDGECKPNAVLAECKSFNGDDKSCEYVNEKCGEELKEFKSEAETGLKRGNLLTTIPKIALEWSVSVDIKPIDTVHSYGSIFHFTSSDNDCCSIGDRIPGVWFFGRSFRLYIANQIDWSGNRVYNGITLIKNKWSTLKIQQKKEADNKYYIFVYLDGQQKLKLLNRMVKEYRHVKVYSADPWYEAANARIKNFVFKNEGDFLECDAICNKPVGDPAYGQVKPITFSFPEERTLKAADKGRLLTTISSVQKEWKLSFDLKINNDKIRVWQSIIHATTSGNTGTGNRIPAVFLNGNLLHNTNQLGRSWNNAYNTRELKKGQFYSMVYEQKKEADGKYYYNINVDGKSKYKREQTMPTVFDNVKYYESDPWYQPADASVKNIKFENYEAGYPCTDTCKGSKSTETVDGEEVATFTYEYSKCKDKAFSVKMTPAPFTRLACAHIRYKVGKPLTSMRCDLVLRYEESTRVKRVRVPKYDVWYHEKVVLQTYSSLVGVYGWISTKCSSVTVAEMKIVNGGC